MKEIYPRGRQGRRRRSRSRSGKDSQSDDGEERAEEHFMKVFGWFEKYWVVNWEGLKTEVSGCFLALLYTRRTWKPYSVSPH